MADPTTPGPDRSEADAPRLDAASDHELIKRAHSRYGAIGAIVAGGMLGIERLLGRKPKDEGAVVWEASGEPGDIDRDGISVDIDETTSVVAHAPRGRSGRHVRKRRNSI
ncbi:MAG: hypothetical protein ACO3SP_00110 [Ilumatobacteraceae bacterium]